MAEKTDYDYFADFYHKWIPESLWGYVGAVVSTSITRLESEGFTREEAYLWLEALSILQLYRMAFPLPPVPVSVFIPDPHVYTEQELMAMLARGETIPETEYIGFEGYY